MEVIWLTNLADTKHVIQRLKELNPHHLSHGIVIFGSARIKEQHFYYTQAQKISQSLAQNSCIITGGGYGIMEAANKGAKDAGAFSVGLNIKLPRENKPNNFLDIQIHFEEFWLRKFFFEQIASAFIIFPGGFGTLDELFDILVLCQTHKRPIRPIVLYGKKFWQPMLHFFNHSLLHEQCIEQDELNLIKIADSLEDIKAIFAC